MTDTPFQLAADFAPADAARWRSLVDAALKGADFDRRLVSRTADGIAIQPLYPRAPRDAAMLGRPAGPWRIAQRVDHPDPKAANALALDDLTGGADMLTLTFAGSAAARGFGLAAPTVDALDAALAAVNLDMIAIRLDPTPDGQQAEIVAGLVSRRGLSAAGLQIDFGLDPVGQAALAGCFPAPWAEVAAGSAATVQKLAAQGFTGPFLTLDLRPADEAGSSEAQDLAIALSTGIAYLRMLEAAGLTLDAARRAISFTVPVDADQLLGLAKLRALRRLWQRIETASGLAPLPARIHAETSWRMATRRDAAVNMLRATMACFVAGIGGADSLTILPHTLALGLPDGAARRIARNIQHVLIEESHLARVADPAAGSGAIEALTGDLMEKAWGLMQDIEREGGIAAALEAGKVQARIAATADARAADIARRKLAITGTSEFPPVADVMPRVLDVAAKSVAAPSGTAFAPLISRRLAAPFEALAEAATAHAHRTGARPKVFLASLGPLAEHSARSLWIANLLAVGGIEAVSEGEGFTASGDAGAAFARSGATVACLCGSDTTYGEIGEATAMALVNAGARKIYLAGRPGALEAALTAAGVTGHLAAGQDVVAVMSALHEVLDVRPV